VIVDRFLASDGLFGPGWDLRSVGTLAMFGLNLGVLPPDLI